MPSGHESGEIMPMEKIKVIDTHTGGEPTRIVVSGGPDLGHGSMAERRELFAAKFDAYRSAIVNEPRGSDVMVGAILCEPVDKSCVAGVLYFNNIGQLWMCGHGTIGVAVALGYMGKIGPGRHKLETAVGTVSFVLDSANTATIENVHSYRYKKDVAVEVEGVGQIVGDIAW